MPFIHQLQQSNMSNHQLRLHQLLTSPSKSDRPELLSLLISQGCDQPDTRFETAYQLYIANPNTDQKYIQMEEIIYNGLALKIDKSFVRKFVMAMKKKLGDCTYVRRLARFVQYLGGGDLALLQDLLREDMSDAQTYKKSIAVLKKSGRSDEYIDKLNKYLSIQPLDQQAWLQLGQLYAQKGHTMKSAFCYQQLILLAPQNDIYTLRLCELYISLNNKNTTQKSIKYLSYLITKRPDNLRALWILYRSIVGNEDYQQLKDMCYEAINKIYSKRNPALKVHFAF